MVLSSMNATTTDLRTMNQKSKTSGLVSEDQQITTKITKKNSR